MSRPLRIEYPGAWYHVMNRGRRGEEIFTERNDYRLFIEVLQESAELFNIINGVQDFEIIYAILACCKDMRAICGGVKKGGLLMSKDAIKV